MLSKARSSVRFSARYRVRYGWLTRFSREWLPWRAEQSGFAFFLQPVAFALDVDGGGMVQQPVQDGGGQDRIAEDLAPVDEALVAGQDDGGALVFAALYSSQNSCSVTPLRFNSRCAAGQSGPGGGTRDEGAGGNNRRSNRSSSSRAMTTQGGYIASEYADPVTALQSGGNFLRNER